MNATFSPTRRNRATAIVVAVAWFTTVTMLAFPPAPHHFIFGTVRDEMGNPLANPGVQVLLEAGGVALVRTTLAPGESGINYRLAIPLDSGATLDLYKPTALRPSVPFRMRIRIGTVTYLPIEMTGAVHLLTRPGESSRVDLTVGVDSDGDGLPDAWEWALMQILGGDLTLEDIRPGDDSDGDGLSNLDEYLAGTYAFDPADGFALAIVSRSTPQPLVEFTAIRGRTYTMHASDDMITWTAASFALSADPSGAPGRDQYWADQTRLMRVRIAAPAEGAPPWRFLKLQVR